MLRSEPMTKTLLCLTALLILTGCRSTARIKATPLKEQNATQVAADRKKCDEWSKSAGSVLTGYASCLVAAGYETEAERPLGFIKKWIRDTFGGWTFNAGKRRQVFVDCLTPRGYEIGKR